MTGVLKKVKIRFFSKVDIPKDRNECWEWKAGCFSDGYGESFLNGKNEKAHRVSWRIHYGEIPDGLCVCHKCDNIKCVNPKHLFLGTQLENIKDRVKKGRCRKQDGELSSRAKLTNQNVLAIRDLIKSNIAQGEIAKCYNVQPSAISKIKTGETWSHI